MRSLPGNHVSVLRSLTTVSVSCNTASARESNRAALNLTLRTRQVTHTLGDLAEWRDIGMADGDAGTVLA